MQVSPSLRFARRPAGRARIPIALLPLALVQSSALLPRSASAMFHAGALAGMIERSASDPNDLAPGVGYGVHGDLDLLPLLRLGPYYLHYALSAADGAQPGAADARFDVLGLRTRLTLPLAAGTRAFFHMGAGCTWARYTPAGPDRSGRFLEVPIGVGIGQEVLERLELSLDVAYRPGLAFAGDAFGDAPAISRPGFGWSVLFDATVDF